MFTGYKERRNETLSLRQVRIYFKLKKISWNVLRRVENSHPKMDSCTSVVISDSDINYPSSGDDASQIPQREDPFLFTAESGTRMAAFHLYEAKLATANLEIDLEEARGKNRADSKTKDHLLEEIAELKQSIVHKDRLLKNHDK